MLDPAPALARSELSATVTEGPSGGLNAACATCFVGIWIEKGMGLIVPGFVPTPLGQVVEYLPTLNETLVCLGIWAFGALVYSWMLHVAVPIMNGSLTAHPEAEVSGASASALNH